MATKKKRGRKPIWETHIKPRLKDIQRWYSEGVPEKEIVKNLGISKTTFYDCKAKYSELTNCLIDGRSEAIENLENMTYKTAMGFKYEEEKIIIQLDEDGKAIRKVKEVYTKYQAPNPAQQQYLLNNWTKGKYTKDPVANTFREEELKLKKMQIDKNDW